MEESSGGGGAAPMDQGSGGGGAATTQGSGAGGSGVDRHGDDGVGRQRREVFEKLVAGGYVEAAEGSSAELRSMLEAHFDRLPLMYQLYVSEKAKDVLTHMKLLEEARASAYQPTFHVQSMTLKKVNMDSRSSSDFLRGGDETHHDVSTRLEEPQRNIYEIIFASIEKPMLFRKLSVMLSDLGLSIKRAYAFSTKHGYSLDVFLVEGWMLEDIASLHKELKASVLIEKENAKDMMQQKLMESFKGIISDSLAFLFPAVLAILTSNFEFHEEEKIFLVALFGLGALLILFSMILAHGVHHGPRKTAVVSGLTFCVVIYVYAVFSYCLYKFIPAAEYSITSRVSSGCHFMFGVVVLTLLWELMFNP